MKKPDSHTGAALAAADLILKGNPVTVTVTDLDHAMYSIAKAERADGETVEQAFARLVVEKDARVLKLQQAQEVLRLPDLTKRADLAALVKDVEKTLDEHVAANLQPGESKPAGYARLLAKRDDGFLRIAALLERARGAHDGA